MTTYTYKKVIYNGVNGWLSVLRVAGIYQGQQFGRTKKAAREALFTK